VYLKSYKRQHYVKGYPPESAVDIIHIHTL
jgi:hypothetical protein